MVFYPWEDKPKRTLTAKEKEIFRDALYPKQQGMCAACKEKVSKKNMHLDHIKAHATGGSDSITNLQLLCGHCNSSKGTKTQAQFKKALATKQAKSTTKDGLGQEINQQGQNNQEARRLRNGKPGNATRSPTCSGSNIPDGFQGQP